MTERIDWGFALQAYIDFVMEGSPIVVWHPQHGLYFCPACPLPYPPCLPSSPLPSHPFPVAIAQHPATGQSCSFRLPSVFSPSPFPSRCPRRGQRLTAIFVRLSSDIWVTSATHVASRRWGRGMRLRLTGVGGVCAHPCFWGPLKVSKEEFALVSSTCTTTPPPPHYYPIQPYEVWFCQVGFVNLDPSSFELFRRPESQAIGISITVGQKWSHEI